MMDRTLVQDEDAIMNQGNRKRAYTGRVFCVCWDMGKTLPV